MNERRPMSQALRTAELPPGAMDFIKAGTPQPLHPMAAAVIPKPASEPQPKPVGVVDAGEDSQSIDPAGEQRPVAKLARPRPPREPEPEVLPLRNLVTLSIRVRPEITDALLRAATERKLQRLKAHRQQEIAAEALTQWLVRHGYLTP